MTKKILFYSCLFFLAAFFHLQGAEHAEAASPWQWQFSLKQKGKSQQPILMPTSVYVDGKRERYYVVDPLANSIHSYDRAGEYEKTFNPGDSLSTPFDMTRDDAGVMLVVERGRNSLMEIDLNARKMTPRKLKIKGRDLFPDRIAMSGGKVFILDKFSGAIFRFDRQLSSYQEFSCEDCDGLINFKVKEKSLWALGRNNKTVFQFNSKGKVVKEITLDHDFEFPFALEVGPSGLLYILDRHKGEIVVFDQSGKFKYSFLTKGHTRGRIYYPEDLVFDPWGRLCVVDGGNGRVEVFGR